MMDITSPRLEICTNNSTKVLDEPEKYGRSKFNDKTIEIVVATRQYPYGGIFSRGFGDIVSGVKELEYLRNIFPEAKCSFVFEHYADNTGELEKLMLITTSEDVKTFILNGRHKTNVQSSDQPPLLGVHQEAELCRGQNIQQNLKGDLIALCALVFQYPPENIQSQSEQTFGWSTVLIQGQHRRVSMLPVPNGQAPRECNGQKSEQFIHSGMLCHMR